MPMVCPNMMFNACQSATLWQVSELHAALVNVWTRYQHT